MVTGKLGAGYVIRGRMFDYTQLKRVHLKLKYLKIHNQCFIQSQNHNTRNIKS